MADLVTLADDVFPYLGLSADPGGFLAKETARVSAAIRKHCGRRPLGEVLPKQEDLDGGHVELLLRFLPIVVLTSVTDRSDGTVKPSTEYGFEAGTGIGLLTDTDGLPTGAAWGAGSKRWRVAYTAGATPVPDDVKEAALQAIAGAWHRRNPGTAASSSAGVTTTFRDGLPKETLRLLAPYRDLVL